MSPAANPQPEISYRDRARYRFTALRSSRAMLLVGDVAESDLSRGGTASGTGGGSTRSFEFIRQRGGVINSRA